jgi:predicted anti-sigma-YlaC factor YlaD
MNCKDIKEALHAYCDGEASSLEKKIIEEHLLSCASCQAEVA